MLHEELTFVGTCDIAGLVRGKGFPSSELERRRKKGIGWTHSNLMQTCFGPIFDTPFGTGGDLMIVPDPAAEVRVDFGEGSGIGASVEHFFLGDIRNTDGSPWECCPREFLRRAIAALKEVSGLELSRRLRAGIRLYRDRGSARPRLQSQCVPPPGSLRRELRRGASRSRRHARLLPHRIRSAPVRGDGRACARARSSGPCRDHPRDGTSRLPFASAIAPSSRRCRSPTASATACISISACATQKGQPVRPMTRKVRSA